MKYVNLASDLSVCCCMYFFTTCFTHWGKGCRLLCEAVKCGAELQRHLETREQTLQRRALAALFKRCLLVPLDSWTAEVLGMT